MSKIKSLLLASSVCIATVCINFPAHATERHLLEQTVSYEELGNVLRYRQSWVDYPAYTDRKSWKEKTAPEMRELIIRNGERALKHEWKPVHACRAVRSGLSESRDVPSVSRTSRTETIHRL